MPTVWHEDEVLPGMVGYALGAGGIKAAQRVSYRAGMLPLP